MRRLWLLAPLFVAGFLWSDVLMGEAQKAEKTPSSKRAQLPPYYKGLGLTAKQRNEVLEIRRKYAAEIQELQQKIDELRDREKVDCASVLTAKQKARLKQILLGSDKDMDEKDIGKNNKKKEPAAKGKKIDKAAKDKPDPVEIKK